MEDIIGMGRGYLDHNFEGSDFAMDGGGPKPNWLIFAGYPNKRQQGFCKVSGYCSPSSGVSLS